MSSRSLVSLFIATLSILFFMSADDASAYGYSQGSYSSGGYSNSSYSQGSYSSYSQGGYALSPSSGGSWSGSSGGSISSGGSGVSSGAGSSVSGGSSGSTGSWGGGSTYTAPESLSSGGSSDGGYSGGGSGLSGGAGGVTSGAGSLTGNGGSSDSSGGWGTPESLSSGGSGGSSYGGGSSASASSCFLCSVYDNTVAGASAVVDWVKENVLGIEDKPTYTSLPSTPTIYPTPNTGTYATPETPSRPSANDVEVPSFVYEQFARDSAIERASSGAVDVNTAKEQELLDRMALLGYDANAAPVVAAAKDVLKSNGGNVTETLRDFGSLGTPQTVSETLKADIAVFGETPEAFKELGITPESIDARMKATDELIRKAEEQRQSAQTPTLNCTGSLCDSAGVKVADLNGGADLVPAKPQIVPQPVYESDKRLIEQAQEKTVQTVLAQASELMSGRPLRENEEALIRAHIAMGSPEETSKVLAELLPEDNPNNGTTLFQATIDPNSDAAKKLGLDQYEIDAIHEVEGALREGRTLSQAQIQALTQQKQALPDEAAPAIVTAQPAKTESFRDIVLSAILCPWCRQEQAPTTDTPFGAFDALKTKDTLLTEDVMTAYVQDLQKKTNAPLNPTYQETLRRSADNYVASLENTARNVPSVQKGLVQTAYETVRDAVGFGPTPAQKELEYTADRILAAQNVALEAKRTAEEIQRQLATSPAVSEFNQTAAMWAVAAELDLDSNTAATEAEINTRLAAHYARQGDAKTAEAYLKVAEYQASVVAFNKLTTDLLLNDPTNAYNVVYTLEDDLEVSQKITNAEQAILDALGINANDSSSAHAVLGGLRKDDFSEVDISAIGKTFMGELLDGTRNALMRGDATPEQMKEATHLLAVIVERAYSQDTTFAFQAQRCTGGICQFSWANTNDEDARAYRQDTLERYNNNQEKVDKFVTEMIDGTAASKYGLANLLPGDEVDHYYQPDALKTKTIYVEYNGETLLAPYWAERMDIVGRTTDGHVYLSDPFAYNAPRPGKDAATELAFTTIYGSDEQWDPSNFEQVGDLYTYIRPDGLKDELPLLTSKDEVKVATSDCSSWFCSVGSAVSGTTEKVVEMTTDTIRNLVASDDARIAQENADDARILAESNARKVQEDLVRDNAQRTAQENADDERVAQEIAQQNIQRDLIAADNQRIAQEAADDVALRAERALLDVDTTPTDTILSIISDPNLNTRIKSELSTELRERRSYNAFEYAETFSTEYLERVNDGGMGDISANDAHTELQRRRNLESELAIKEVKLVEIDPTTGMPYAVVSPIAVGSGFMDSVARESARVAQEREQERQKLLEDLIAADTQRVAQEEADDARILAESIARKEAQAAQEKYVASMKTTADSYIAGLIQKAAQGEKEMLQAEQTAFLKEQKAVAEAYVTDLTERGVLAVAQKEAAIETYGKDTLRALEAYREAKEITSELSKNKGASQTDIENAAYNELQAWKAYINATEAARVGDPDTKTYIKIAEDALENNRTLIAKVATDQVHADLLRWAALEDEQIALADARVLEDAARRKALPVATEVPVKYDPVEGIFAAFTDELKKYCFGMCETEPKPSPESTIALRTLEQQQQDALNRYAPQIAEIEAQKKTEAFLAANNRQAQEYIGSLEKKGAAVQTATAVAQEQESYTQAQRRIADAYVDGLISRQADVAVAEARKAAVQQDLLASEAVRIAQENADDARLAALIPDNQVTARSTYELMRETAAANSSCGANFFCYIGLSAPAVKEPSAPFPTYESDKKLADLAVHEKTYQELRSIGINTNYNPAFKTMADVMLANGKSPTEIKTVFETIEKRDAGASVDALAHILLTESTESCMTQACLDAKTIAEASGIAPDAYVRLLTGTPKTEDIRLVESEAFQADPTLYAQMRSLMQRTNSATLNLIQNISSTCFGFCEPRIVDVKPPMFEIEPLTFPPLEEKEVVAVPDPNQQLGREEVEDVFKNYGITKWESAPGATELGGLRLQTVDAMISLKDSCGCDLTITGGAETQSNDTGLYTHASGNKFDVRTKDNPELVEYVSSLSKVEGAQNKYFDPKDPHVVYTLNNYNLDVTVLPFGSSID